MNGREVATTISDCIAFVSLTQITASEVLNWIYTIIFCVSVVFSIIIKIVQCARDKKITSEEAQEIKDEVQKGLKEIKEEVDNVHNQK